MDALMVQNLKNMTREELRELNKFVIQLIRAADAEKQARTALSFSIGDKVRFQHCGQTHHGTITKCNPKTASLTASLTELNNAQLTRWNVSWTLLTKENNHGT